MTIEAALLATLPKVRGVIDYLAPMEAPPHYYTFEPPPGVPRSNAVYDRRTVTIHDLRPVAGRLSLDREGLMLVAHRSALADFHDEAALAAIHFPEIEALVAGVTGAARVVIFDHTIRQRLDGPDDRTKPGPRPPVLRAHNDYTERSGPQRVRDLMGAEAPALLARRFALINVWRPILGPLTDRPLALCDAATTAPDDLVVAAQLYHDRTGEIFLLRHAPAHRWYYAPRMTRDEALLIKCYDSRRDGTARFTAHAAFEDPTTPADGLPRDSIELRTIAFFDGD